MAVGGIVLCGGRSERMGRSKAHLPFGPERMLQRVVRLLGDVVRPIVVVAAPGQDLPELAADVRVVRDRTAGCGPLEGLYCGLCACAKDVDAAFVTGCDTPLLTTAWIQEVLEQLGTCDVAVPRDERRLYPLSAVYRTAVSNVIRGLLDRRQYRLQDLFGHVTTSFIDVDALRKVDPDLDSLLNINSPADYRGALSRAGLTPPG